MFWEFNLWVGQGDGVGIDVVIVVGCWGLYSTYAEFEGKKGKVQAWLVHPSLQAIHPSSPPKQRKKKNQAVGPSLQSSPVQSTQSIP